MKILPTSTCIFLTFLLLSAALSVIITPQKPSQLQETLFDETDYNIRPSRRLQSGQVAVLKSDQIFHKVLADIKLTRTAKNLPALTQNARLDQVLSQWYDKKMMSLVQYLQLMGILKIQLYEFQQLPVEYVSIIISRQCTACFSKDYTEIAGLIKETGNGGLYVLIGVIGGYSATIKNYGSSNITYIVNAIKQQNPENQAQSSEVTDQSTNSQISNEQSQNTFKSQTSSAQSISNSVTNIQTSYQQTQQNQQSQIEQTTQTYSSQSIQVQQSLPAANSYGYILPSILENQPTQPKPTAGLNTQSTIKVSVDEIEPVIVVPTVDGTASNQKPLVAQQIFGTTPINDLILDHDIPTAFLRGQTFVFRGSLTSNNPSGTYVNVIFTRRNDSSKMSFSQYVTQNNKSFRIEAYLSQAGDFFLAIFSGFRGSAMKQLFVVEERFLGQLVSRAPEPVKNASLSLIENDLYIQWTCQNVPQPGLTLLVFSQGSQNKIFMLSNYASSFKIPQQQFANFRPGKISVSISLAFSNTESCSSRTSDYSSQITLTATAVRHDFASFTPNNGINKYNLKIKKGESILLRGMTTGPVKNEVILQTPYNTFESYLIDKSKTVYAQLPAGTNINISIPFTTEGVYILEVNDADGAAIVNAPVYVGDIWPFLPDFKDLSPKSYNTNDLNFPTDINSRRQLVLDLVNKARARYGVEHVFLDVKLNSLAQNHSQNMVDKNFFGHVDPQGRSPSQRAQQAGIIEGVGQNIALNINLTEAQLSLERSPAHLRNMVKESWTRVGLGITQNSKGHYYLSQQFSSRDLTLNPLSPQEMKNIQQQIVEYLIEKYPKITYQDTEVSSILKQYQDSGSVEGLGTFLRSRGINRNSMLLNMVVSYNGGNYMELVERTSNYNLGNANFDKVGLSVAFREGRLEIFGVIS